MARPVLCSALKGKKKQTYCTWKWQKERNKEHIGRKHDSKLLMVQNYYSWDLADISRDEYRYCTCLRYFSGWQCFSPAFSWVLVHSFIPTSGQKKRVILFLVRDCLVLAKMLRRFNHPNSQKWVTRTENKWVRVRVINGRHPHKNLLGSRSYHWSVIKMCFLQYLSIIDKTYWSPLRCSSHLTSSSVIGL